MVNKVVANEITRIMLHQLQHNRRAFASLNGNFHKIRDQRKIKDKYFSLVKIFSKREKICTDH